jgi:hypothetical protein
MRNTGENMNIIIDKEFKSLIEPMTDDERSQLEANILEEGCRDPLVVWARSGDVILLDGHNRYEICTKNDIEFDTVERHFDSRSEAIIWMIDNQFGRRNLNTAQRATLALRVEKEWAKLAKANQVASGKDFGKGSQNSANPINPIDTRKELAKMANVSHDTIAKVKKIHAEADEETKAKMMSNEISINKAYQTVKKPKVEVATETAPIEVVEEKKPVGLVGFAMSYAEGAINNLKKIPHNDIDRERALRKVLSYIKNELK